MKEIERKFLVNDMPDLCSSISSEIIQGYISLDPEIRIRHEDDKFLLAQKGKGTLVRDEDEPEIDERAFNILSKIIIGNLIYKTRYEIPLGNGLKAQLDIYHGKLDGLVTVEVEFPTLEQAEVFETPVWFGEDVTERKEFKNKNLAQLEDISSLINPIDTGVTGKGPYQKAILT